MHDGYGPHPAPSRKPEESLKVLIGRTVAIGGGCIALLIEARRYLRMRV